jgi:uncharacterized RDD family membrane protein YckC
VQPLTEAPAVKVSPIILPKAKTSRRLLGSGVEFTCYAAGVWVVTVLDLSGLFGLLTVVIVGLVILRDFNGGAFSISKRVSQMRVVDWRTGRPVSNPQAFLRNSYYLALPAVAILPLVDCFTSWLFMMFIALDIMMIIASRQGRRLGDRLAGTQVVDIEARA